MLIIRPAEVADLDALISLANSTGGGLTTLPPDPINLSNKIAWSFESFFKNMDAVGEDYYFMVLEETDTNTIMGTTAIFTGIGSSVPFYNYRLMKKIQVSKEPELRMETEMLTLVNDYTGATELGTLFLHPEHRKGPAGRFLSKCRFMLMKAFPERFNEIIVAELRGWVDENGTSPFWDAIGKKFFQMSFHEADRINGSGNNQFIGDMMPKYPIYTNLLNDEARDVIGKPHDSSAAALKLLKDEGFAYHGAVDIFDSGPLVDVRMENIRTINMAQNVKLSATKPVVDGKEMMIANKDLNEFRSTFSAVEFNQKGVVVSDQVAALLKIIPGDDIVVSELLGYKG